MDYCNMFNIYISNYVACNINFHTCEYIMGSIRFNSFVCIGLDTNGNSKIFRKEVKFDSPKLPQTLSL